jgi:hypothetical protein
VREENPKNRRSQQDPRHRTQKLRTDVEKGIPRFHLAEPEKGQGD